MKTQHRYVFGQTTIRKNIGITPIVYLAPKGRNKMTEESYNGTPFDPEKRAVQEIEEIDKKES
jgi:hypothetical protein